MTKLSKLSKDKIISKPEKERRKKRAKKTRGTYKTRTPRQKLQVLCHKYGLSEHGTVIDLRNRLFKEILAVEKAHMTKGAPVCFGLGYVKILCSECYFIEDCKSIIKDIKKANKAVKLAELKEKMR